jgi:hypothetical protein
MNPVSRFGLFFALWKKNKFSPQRRRGRKDRVFLCFPVRGRKAQRRNPRKKSIAFMADPFLLPSSQRQQENRFLCDLCGFAVKSGLVLKVLGWPAKATASLDYELGDSSTQLRIGLWVQLGSGQVLRGLRKRKASSQIYERRGVVEKPSRSGRMLRRKPASDFSQSQNPGNRVTESQRVPSLSRDGRVA